MGDFFTLKIEKEMCSSYLGLNFDFLLLIEKKSHFIKTIL